MQRDSHAPTRHVAARRRHPRRDDGPRPRVRPGEGRHPRVEAPRLGAPVDAGDQGDRGRQAGLPGHRRAQPPRRRQGVPHARAGEALPRGDGRGRRARGGQPRRRLGPTAQGDPRRARRGPPRPIPHLRPHRLLRHRRAGLVGPRGGAAGRELRGRGQGAEVPQDAGPGRPLQGRPLPAGRRPEARPDLGGLRPVQAAGRDPHGATPAPSSRRSTGSASAGTS